LKAKKFKSTMHKLV